MKHFYLVVNPEKDPAYTLSKKVRAYLENRGGVCSVKTGKDPKGNYYYTDPAWVPEEAECIIVLGGDGTMIQAARDLSDRALPILGVKLGTMGYLAGTTQEGIYEALERLLRDDYDIEERMMLEGTSFAGGVESSEIALNDIVISRRGDCNMIHFQVSVNGEVLHRYAADGIIVATPTGSTAYNLSAGGPIAAPASSLILLTPIAAHSLNNRSIVLTKDDEIRVQLCGGHAEEAGVIFDGKIQSVLTVGDTVTVRRAQKVTRLIKLKQTSFLETLRENMTD